MLNNRKFLRQYQVRSIDCGNRYVLAEKLLAIYGYNQAVQICKKNHWTGILQKLATIHGM